MKNTLNNMINHPIASAIVISATLNGIANIIREVNKLCKLYNE